MDNQHKPELPKDDNWLDGILVPPTLSEEIGPDEHAVSSAGLLHPDDVELERIIQETKTEDWSASDPGVTDTTAIFDTQAFHSILAEEDLKPEPTPEPMENTIFSLPILDEAEADAPESEPEAEEEDEGEPDPRNKRRPHRKQGYGLFGIPHILATAVWLIITVIIGVTLGRMVWVCAADVLAFGKESNVITVTITENDNIDTIASKLKNAGLIRYPGLFKLYGQLTDAEEEISAGTYELNSSYDYHALVNNMNPYSSTRETKDVMIPEGYTCAQIFALLEEEGVCTAAELESYAASGELSDFWFLEGITRGDRYCLEGYLFPDTYNFYTNDSPRSVLEKMLDGFNYRFTDVMKEKIAPLNERFAEMLREQGHSEEFIAQNQITIREVVIIASMIEKETSGADESFTISSVIYNRLAWDQPRYLNIDATLIYALGGNIDPETGKTLPLTEEDLRLESPYNTYTNTGLTPGPISNPGRSSLDAALDPEDTNYYYYVYNPQAYGHVFSKTYEEHLKNIAEIQAQEPLEAQEVE